MYTYVWACWYLHDHTFAYACVTDGRQVVASRLTDLDREPGTQSPSDDLPLKEAIANLERSRLLDALDASRWHQARAAERLGLSYHQMRALLRKYPDIKKP